MGDIRNQAGAEATTGSDATAGAGWAHPAAATARAINESGPTRHLPMPISSCIAEKAFSRWIREKAFMFPASSPPLAPVLWLPPMENPSIALGKMPEMMEGVPWQLAAVRLALVFMDIPGGWHKSGTIGFTVAPLHAPNGVPDARGSTETDTVLQDSYPGARFRRPSGDEVPLV